MANINTNPETAGSESRDGAREIMSDFTMYRQRMRDGNN